MKKWSIHVSSFLPSSFPVYFGYMCVTLGVLYGLALIVPSLGRMLYRAYFPGAMTDPARKSIAYLYGVTLIATYLLIGTAWIMYGENTTTSIAIAVGLIGLICGGISMYYRYQLRKQ
jgi:hypothetical protein